MPLTPTPPSVTLSHSPQRSCDAIIKDKPGPLGSHLDRKVQRDLPSAGLQESQRLPIPQPSTLPCDRQVPRDPNVTLSANGPGVCVSFSPPLGLTWKDLNKPSPLHTQWAIAQNHPLASETRTDPFRNKASGRNGADRLLLHAQARA